MPTAQTVVIIGVGLIGGSIGISLKSLDNPPKVIGVDKSIDTLSEAIRRGAIDDTSSDYNIVSQADLIFIATPVRKILPIIKKISGNLKENAIVTDVGSTKLEIVTEAEKIIDRGNFIGGHPMTGSEVTGVSGSSVDLLKNCFYILTPTENTDSRSYEILHSLLAKIGAKIIAIKPDEHDEIMSVISHLPHIVSASLVNLTKQARQGKGDMLLLTAGGFRDMTRIAASNPDVWVDICLSNKDLIKEAVERYIAELVDFKKLIASGDEKNLHEKLFKARQIRQNLPGVIPIEPEKITTIRVEISDKPGAISDVTLAIGEKGINIDDLEMIHSFEERKARLQLMISNKSKADEAVEILKRKGYTVQKVTGETT